MTVAFSGSYLPSDVQFLLQQLTIQATDIAEKERLIQSGQKHYSEMLSEEPVPTPVHQALYQQALADGGQRFATEIQSLALALAPLAINHEITLVSFVRAGLPIAVSLKRALQALGISTHHYGISIIRDKGIDAVALDFIIQKHGVASLFFVDGWTGKGAIAQELTRSLAQDSRFSGTPRLVTLADPCGHAWLAPSADDWLIPSGILGATISGLVSRSLLTSDGGFHGCMPCQHLAEYDVTQAFVDHIDCLRLTLSESPVACRPWTTLEKDELQRQSKQTIAYFAERYQVTNINRIKVGIAEATRAVMRRVPEHVFVCSREDADVQLLVHLAEQLGIEIKEAGQSLGAYRALTIIKSIRP